MKVHVHPVDFTVDHKLVEFIQKKLDKLDNFYDRIIEADVHLKLDNTTTKENKIVEIKINVPGDSFVVKKQFKSYTIETVKHFKNIYKTDEIWCIC